MFTNADAFSLIWRCSIWLFGLFAAIVKPSRRDAGAPRAEPVDTAKTYRFPIRRSATYKMRVIEKTMRH
jgi:hypothetical protein